MYFLAHVAQLAGEHQFHLRVHVLYSLLNAEESLLAYSIDVLQLGQQRFEFILFHQPDTFEHGDVGHASHHVVLGQIEVHFAVAPHSEAFYLAVHLKVFLPQFVCHPETFFC